VKGYKVRLHREKKMLNNVEDPRKMNNEPLYNQPWLSDLDACLVMDGPQSLDKSLEPHTESYKRSKDW